MSVLAIANRVWLMVQNKRKEDERAYRQLLEVKNLKGDGHPDFIYTLSSLAVIAKLQFDGSTIRSIPILYIQSIVGAGTDLSFPD